MVNTDMRGGESLQELLGPGMVGAKGLLVCTSNVNER